jgi:hypothetical protein
MNKQIFLLLVWGIALIPAALCAWTDHTPMTGLIFASDADLEKKIKSEPLERFLAKEQKSLASVLQNEEQWLRSNLSYYPPRPDALAFSPDLSAPDLRAAFLRAIRINPTMPLPLYTRVPVGKIHTRPGLADSMVSIIPVQVQNAPFEKLKPGEEITALEVLSTATDEPDYGMDVNLYENNKSSFGKEYGFGVQPWGNDAYAYGTQAPFHMGFFHENPLIAAAAPFSQQSLSLYRFHQYSSLASFAFKTGHTYWGYRFAGWALHYLQDSLSIYHERMLPGVSAAKIISVSASGDKKERDALLNSVSNKHYIFEDYAYYALKNLLNEKKTNDPLILALSDRSKDSFVPAPTPLYISDVTGALSESRSDEIDRLVISAFPAKFISDPSYIYGTTEPAIDLYSYLKKEKPDAFASVNGSYREVFLDIGAFSRAYISWVKVSDVSSAVHKRRTAVWIMMILVAVFLTAVFIKTKRRRNRKTRQDRKMMRHK